MIRFGLVGIANTAVDTSLFVLFRFAGISLLIANIFSTSVALTLSLFLNSRYTFNKAKLIRKNVLVYFIVTLSGVWILQPVVIKLITTVNNANHMIESFTKPFGHSQLFIVLVPKLFSILFTLVWNYFWYSKLVFRTAKA